jgi:hypothetical protein
MPLLQTNPRLSDTNRPDVATYLPPSIFRLGFTTYVRETASATRCKTRGRSPGCR